MTSRPAACAFAVALVACGRHGFDTAETWSFVDASQAQFDLGSYDTGAARLVWRDGSVTLAGAPPYDPEQIGLYVSRSFDTGSGDAIWDTLAWVPIAPSSRPLPDDGGADTGYAGGGVTMTDNIMLLHFEGDGDATHGSTVIDRSGREHHGRMIHAGQGARIVPGVFGSALDIDRDAYISLDGNYFDFGTGDFTWAVWTKFHDCSQSNDNRIAMGGAGANDTPHVWIGALCPDACAAGDGAHMTIRDSTRNGTTLTACTGVVLHDGRWHHIAATKSGHTSALVQLFVDGRQVASTTYGYAASTTFDYDGDELRLGSFNLNDPQYHTRAMVDEAAIWKRALSGPDVAALYQRGAIRLQLQIRSCADRICDSEAFVGPDGTAATWFTEVDLVGPAGSQEGNLASLGLTGGVAQYRVAFSTESPTLSPGLAEVTLTARDGG